MTTRIVDSVGLAGTKDKQNVKGEALAARGAFFLLFGFLLLVLSSLFDVHFRGFLFGETDNDLCIGIGTWMKF